LGEIGWPSAAAAQSASSIGYKTAANNCSRFKAKRGTASTAELIRIAIGCGLDQDAGRPGLSVDTLARPE
jgi:hypothetical protein